VQKLQSETFKSKPHSTFVSTTHCMVPPQHRLPETGTARLAFAPTRCECCVDVIAKPGLHCVCCWPGMHACAVVGQCGNKHLCQCSCMHASRGLHACQPPSFCSRVGGPTRSCLRWPAFGELGTSRSTICSGYWGMRLGLSLPLHYLTHACVRCMLVTEKPLHSSVGATMPSSDRV